MKALSRLCCAALAVVTLGGAACSPDSAPKEAPTPPSSGSTPTAGKESPSTAPDDGPFPANVNIGSKVDQPGFNVLRAHRWIGFEADLSASLGRELGFTPQYLDVPSAARETLLLSGGVTLVIATYSITPQRAQQVDFVGPYLKTRQGLLVKKGKKGKTEIKTVADTAGKTICTVQGSTSAPERDPAGQGNYLHEDAKFIYLSDYQACVDDVYAGTSDAVWTDIPILYGYADNKDMPMEVVEGIEVGKNQLYGIGIHKGYPQRCRALEGALKNFLRDEWLRRFTTRFSSLTEANPDFEASYKPTEEEVDQHTTCG